MRWRLTISTGLVTAMWFGSTLLYAREGEADNAGVLALGVACVAVTMFAWWAERRRQN